MTKATPRTALLQIRLTPEGLAACQRSAAAAQLNLSEWARQQLIRAGAKPRNRAKAAPKHHNPPAGQIMFDGPVPAGYIQLCKRCARLGTPSCPACRKGAGL